MQKSYTETTYVICHNGTDIIHPIKVEPGTNLTSGQPEIEEFSDETLWRLRLTELGFNISKLYPPDPDPKDSVLENQKVVDRLSVKERKSLSPEERKARREERLAARITPETDSPEVTSPKLLKVSPKTRSRKKAS